MTHHRARSCGPISGLADESSRASLLQQAFFDSGLANVPIHAILLANQMNNECRWRGKSTRHGAHQKPLRDCGVPANGSRHPEQSFC